MPVKGGTISVAQQSAMVAAARRATLGVPKTPEHRAKLAAASRGRRLSPHARALISAARTGVRSTDEQRAALSASRRGRTLSPAQREALRNRVYTPEHRARIGAAQRRSWSGMTAAERSARIGPATQAAGRVNPSSIELTVRAILDTLGIAYEPAHPIGPYVADIFIPAARLVVECDGEYWHRHTAERDRRRDEYMANLGLRVLRLPEPDIRAGLATPRLLNAIGVAS